MTDTVSTPKFFTLDSWTLRYNVTDEATGLAKDLTSASIMALARKSSTTVSLMATGTVTGLLVTIPVGVLTPGAWRLQVRVTIGTDTQTFEAILPIGESFI